MRNSLYDALEVSPSASTPAIQIALRGVVRRFWSVPRDASGDSEEAVRFAALAAAILVDRIRRKDYDAALNPGVGAGPWRLPIGGSSAREAAAEAGSTQSRILAESGADVSQLSIEASVPKSLPGVDALADPLADGTAWSSPLVWLGLVASLILLVFACLWVVPVWFHGSLTYGFVGALLAIAILMAFAFALSRPKEAMGPAAGLSRLGIIKWRREGSIFIGVPPPQHDTAWIFKLRLMELTRSAAGFVTATNVQRRLFARIIDYAIVGMALYGGLALGERLMSSGEIGFLVTRSPFVLPVLVVLATIPLEVFSLKTFRTTPGKWLMGLVVVSGITCPADHRKPGTVQLAWARATRSAWAGAAFGIWPVALIRLAGNWRDIRDREADWDACGDSVVMARPMTLATVGTGLAVVLSMVLILATGWRTDYAVARPYWMTWAATSESALARLVVPRATTPELAAVTPAVVPTEPVSPAPVTAESVPATAASISLPVVPKPVPPIVKPAAPTSVSVNEAQVDQQVSAAQARRARIDGYARQLESARRSGGTVNYAGLQGSCQRWTVDQPGNAEAWSCLGLAQFQNGTGRGALTALRQSLKLGSKDPQVEDAILRILRP
ncbi:MAG: RDD family protein [Casimicrobium sp.]